MSDEKTFDIDRLRNRVAGHITVNGTRHEVLQIKGGQYQGIKNAKPSEVMPKVFDAAAACVPTLPREVIDDLNLDQANAIVGIAGVGVEAVERLFPNAESPATDVVSTSPG